MRRTAWTLLLSVTLLGLFASGAAAGLIDGFVDSGIPGGDMYVPPINLGPPLALPKPPAAPLGTYVDYKNNIGSEIILAPSQTLGEREVEVFVDDNGPPPQVAWAAVFTTLGASYADLNSPSAGLCEMYLRYGSLITKDDSDPNTWGTDLDADLSNDPYLHFLIIANDHYNKPSPPSAAIRIEVDKDGSDGGPQEYLATAVLNQFSGLMQFPVSSFSRIDDLSGDPLSLTAAADVDGIEYRFYGVNSGFDITVDMLSTGKYIPEPATMTLLGLGALALVRRRRRKKS